ncbi:MAG: phosphoglucosamine mutase [Clostridia bacterium]|nr:phosphoglucosamine mutase [Clostridia bacterium]
MGQLFGTDGVRGIVNRDLSAPLAYDIGRALTSYLKQTHKQPTIAIGKDTRISGDMLEAALTSGILSAGGNVIKLGILPTPAVSLFAKKYQCDGGIMVSASHNPTEYNGIKLFDKNGMKFPDEAEDSIEAFVRTQNKFPNPSDDKIGTLLPSPDAKEDYIEWLIGRTSADFSGMKVALDCANGATSQIAEDVFQRLGAQVFAIGNTPDGININEGCGSTHMENICRFTKENGADFGIAFDGDGDRALFSDEFGNEVDGDQALAVFSYHMMQQNKLSKNTLVATVMSNLGLTLFAKEQGISVISTKVGDRYVWEELQTGGYALGGEQSGHIIFPQDAVTGDGILTALKMAEILSERNVMFSELTRLMTKLPQVLYNVKITKDAKDKITKDTELLAILENTKTILGERGRVLLRPSGTEPLYRVMLEGEDFQKITELGQRIVEHLTKNYSA